MHFYQIKPQTLNYFFININYFLFVKCFDRRDGEAHIIGHHCITCNIFYNGPDMVQEHNNSKNHIKTVKHA